MDYWFGSKREILTQNTDSAMHGELARIFNERRVGGQKRREQTDPEKNKRMETARRKRREQNREREARDGPSSFPRKCQTILPGDGQNPP